MIRHIVAWKLKEGTPQEKRAATERIKAELEGLRPFFPDALIEVGFDIGAVPNSFDVSLYSEFPSVEALKAYQVHPEHQRAGAIVRELVETRAAVDSEFTRTCC